MSRSSFNRISPLRRICAALAALVLCCPLAAAQEQSAQAAGAPPVVQLRSDTELLTAFGVVILEPRSAQAGAEVRPIVRKRSAGVEHKGGDVWEVRVATEGEDMVPGAKLLAVATDKDGKAVSGTVVWLSAPEAQPPPARSCRKQRNIERLAEITRLGEKELRQLVELRKRRRDLLENLLKEIKVPVLFTRLNEAEKKFGIARAEPISESTSFEELVDRLGAVDAWLQASKSPE